MEIPKNITEINYRIDKPRISTSLRKKSIVAQKENSNILLLNNDEAERIALRCESINTSKLSTPFKNNKRYSLGFKLLEQLPETQITEHISECLKLNAANKINIKNAFSLKIIDFMTYMVKTRNSNMANLQLACSSLDVSTKIYSFRVDGVHMDILKMMGALDKQHKNSNFDNSEQQTHDDREVQMPLKKKLKTKGHKQQILSTEDALNGTIEEIHPFSIRMQKGDIQTTDMLYLASLPNHVDYNFYLNLNNHVILDRLSRKRTHTNISKTYRIPQIKQFSHHSICPFLSNFDFLQWSPETEKLQEMQQKNNEDRFQFDFNMDTSSADERSPSPINCFNPVEEHINVNFCNKELHTIDNIIDFRDGITKSAQNEQNVLEYSYIPKNIDMYWAGPLHWKITIPNKLSNCNHKIIEKCQLVKSERKKEVTYDKITKNKLKQTFYQRKRSIMFHAGIPKENWQQRNITLPEDVHYKTMNLMISYLHPLITFFSEKQNTLNYNQEFDDTDDYNNENNMLDHYLENNEEDNQIQENCESGTQLPFTGDNLIAVPKMLNKIIIQYSQQANKINMCELKKSIWKYIDSPINQKEIDVQRETNKETESGLQSKTYFSQIYKVLPNVLSNSNLKALSFPIAFVSLLHLANEKSLNINSLSNMSDIIVEVN